MIFETSEIEFYVVKLDGKLCMFTALPRNIENRIRLKKFLGFLYTSTTIWLKFQLSVPETNFLF